MNNGDRELAIQKYQRSVELNPKNSGGAAMLKKLKQQDGKLEGGKDPG